jgi:hypothetical protein
MTRSLSNEFRLAAACCRWPPSPERDREVAAAADRAIDWEAFLQIVRRQRIEGFANAALRQAQAAVPQEGAASLAAAAGGIAQENLLHAAAALSLHRDFAEAGIELLHLKGVTLSLLAYETLALKKARDIDVVVAPGEAGKAFELLRRAGYRCLSGGAEGEEATEPQPEAAKESVWQGRHDILVELHTGLVDNAMMLPGVGLDSPRQTVAIAPGKSLPTLGTEELFAYLCVHGATHAWSRLKWLADVAALASRGGPAGIELLYRRAEALGAGRSAAQALLLCADLLGTEVPAELVRTLQTDRATRWLVRVAVRTMTGADGARELDETLLGTIPIHLSHFLLARGRRYKLSELKRKSAGRPGAAGAPLRGPLRYLRPLIAVPLWLRARSRERIRR